MVKDELMEEFIKIFTEEGSNLNFWQMSIRAVIVLFFMIAALKIGKKKFLGKNSRLDFILAIIIGSVVSRSINGSSTLISAFAVCIVLILLHSFLSYISTKSKSFSEFFHGTSDILIKNGKLINESLKYHHLEKEDILEAARSHANISELNKIQESYLESNGTISIVKKESK